AGLCGPNSTEDSCFYYAFDLNAPEARAIDPSPGEFSACEFGKITIRLTDDSGIDGGSIVLTVDGVDWTLADPELSYIDDSLLVFEPASPWSDDTIDVSLSASDILGNAIDGFAYSFYIDLSPPELSGFAPSPGSVSTDAPTISFDAADTMTGIDAASLELTVDDDTFHVGDAEVSWDGATFSVAGIAFDDGDEVHCCASAADSPDTCGPNIAGPECWDFYIDESGPTAEIIAPRPNWVSSCADQAISILLTDGNGIDTTTIELLVNGVAYAIGDPRLDFDAGSLLVFAPSPDWTHGDTIDVALTEADDIFGMALTTPLSWSFIIDTEPPEIGVFDPPSGTWITSDTLFSVGISDEPAGVDISSVSIRVGSSLFWVGGGISWDGVRASFNPADLGISLLEGDSLNICIETAADLARICPPNAIPTPECAEYYFDPIGPRAELLSPPDSAWISCPEAEIEILLFDRCGVDPASIALNIDGTVYSWPDAHLDFADSILTFHPDGPWPEGSRIFATLETANDIAGNPLADGALSFIFGVDTTAPTVVATSPTDGDFVDVGLAEITAEIADGASGVDFSRLAMTVNGVSIAFGDAGLSWSGASLRLNLTMAGLSFDDGESVDVCVDSIFDRASMCGANSAADYCWEFMIDAGGPVAELLWPPNGSTVSCADESILVRLTDPAGIEFDSLIFTVSGTDFSIFDAEIDAIDDSTLRFIPASAFSDGEVVDFSVTRSSDAVGHVSGPSPTWSFTIDASPPEASGFYPPAMSVSTGDSIGLILLDAISGVDPASISVEVLGMGTLELSNPALSYSSSVLALDPAVAGLSFGDGDTEGVCVSAADMPDICPPNLLSRECWSFIVDRGGPRIEL
ncbi:hypothetical protein J7L01_01755, partial [bacterium]|nr:hypothetical protein [bacterium]